MKNSFVANKIAPITKNPSGLQKLGDFVGRTAGVLSKILPGVGGKIAEGVANIFNDPEWWSQFPGDGVTLNTPLSIVSQGENMHVNAETTLPVSVTYPRAQLLQLRSPTIEFTSDGDVAVDGYGSPTGGVLTVTEEQANAYLIPSVRQLINAIPLVPASYYAKALDINATLYAIHKTLSKLNYLAKHTPSWMASYSDPKFPIMQTSNAEKLQSLARRVYEAVSANVRLPHTLCEYLSWRFGRVFKSNDSERSAHILYNAIDMTDTTAVISSYIDSLISAQASSPEMQQAVADLYTAYDQHVQDVVIPDDTQGKFDKKEWMLRINLNLLDAQAENTTYSRAVIIDSALDNKTVFMASTVSTICQRGETSDTEAGEDLATLFPVKNAYAFYVGPKYNIQGPPGPAMKLGTSGTYNSSGGTDPTGIIINFGAQTEDTQRSGWSVFYYVEAWYSPTRPIVSAGSHNIEGLNISTNYSYIGALKALIACKSLDCYNMGVYLPGSQISGQAASGAYQYKYSNVDLTAISMDMAMVPSRTIAVEHNYACRNLFNPSRRVSESPKQQLNQEIKADLVPVIETVLPEVTVK